MAGRDLSRYRIMSKRGLGFGDVFWGSNLGNRDGLEAVTGVPAHARALPS